MKEDKDLIINLILGIDSSDNRISTLQLAIKQARRLVGIAKGEYASVTKFILRRCKPDIDAEIMVKSFLEAHTDEEMDLLTSMSLYFIVLDQLGHIFGDLRNNNSNKVKEAIEKSNIDSGLISAEIDEIANLRNSINHNFGLACYSPSKKNGVFKYTICFDDDGNQKPVVDAVEEWEGDWCDKSEKTSVHVYPFSLMNYVEQILNSFIEQHQKGTLKSPLCVEELKTRFTLINNNLK